MTHHEAFGKLLAALQLCSVGGRTDNGDMFQFGTILEVIVDAFTNGSSGPTTTIPMFLSERKR